MSIDFDISLCVPGLPFDGNTLKERSLGGSESAGLYMAKALAKQGQHVSVFCNTPTVSSDEEGVNYLPLQSWHAYVRTTPHDIAIVQRAPEMFANRCMSRLNVLWCHDLALGRQAKTYKASAWNIDQIMTLSDFMTQQYKQVYGFPDSMFYETRNGIDLSAFVPTGKPRYRKRLVYAARPERGLDVLLRSIMPKLKSIDPDLHLVIAGYDNPVAHMQAFYEQCRRDAAAVGAQWVGALTKSQLYDLYQSAGVYVYPTPSPVSPKFAEVSCISAMECQAAGLPIVTSRRGALPETVAHGAGVLIDGDPSSAEYIEAFCAAVLRLTGSESVWQEASRQGTRHARDLSWDAVASDWIAHFEKCINRLNDNDDRLIRHMWRQSDIVTAKFLADAEPDRSAWYGLLKPFDFAFQGEEGFREQYAKIGLTHDDRVFDHIQHEPRYHAMVAWLRGRDDINTVLDYGCGLGGYSVFGQRDTGKQFHGVDIDPATIEIAVSKAAEYKSGARFSVGTHDGLLVSDLVDCAVMQEVLEHVSEPWAVAQAIEAKVKPGGWVYITVPFGPWEYSSYYTYPHRCHIWHFDLHDLRDMFGAKKDLVIDSMGYSESPELGDSLGWWLISYRADQQPIPKIDLWRKLWLQRPRLTVSANIIAGPGSEETLHWCLSSIQHVADEVLIGDCGMSDEGRRIAESHAGKFPSLRLIECEPPTQAGFEAPRNALLAESSMDMILWIDTDEKLIGAKNTHKYLRENVFNGYGIRQHHFACDTTFTPDIPVRVFRRRPVDNERTIRFYGMLHEHPEMGLNDGPGAVVVMSDVHIAHVGYLIEEGRQRRFIRNWPLLKKDIERYPERLLQKHFIMRDNMILVRQALQSNGGRVDAAIEAKCRETINLCQRYFIGKGHYMNSDSLQYYSEALTVLGEGFDAIVELSTAKDQAQPNGALHYRFASREDLQKEIDRRVMEKTQDFEQEYY